MRSGPVYLASDIHLGAVPPETERAFVRWLEHAASNASLIVLNGDLFDFWFEYRHAIPRGHTRVLGALASVIDGGLPVHLLGGNHDWWGGSYLEEEVGVIFHREPVVMELAGRRAFVAHGDGLGRGDLGYRLLKLVLRGRLTRWAFGRLHPDTGASLAARVSHTADAGREPTARDRARAGALEEWAVTKLRDEPDLDLVVLGHTHVPRTVEVDRGRWYVNCGDWVFHSSYVVLEEGDAPRITEWTGEGPR